MKKRILSILLAALMLLSALPLGMVDTAYAAALASGKCGDSATWTLDNTGTLTISGTGATYNYDMDDDGNSAAPWCTKARIQRVNKVVVNSGITELGYSMFSNCTQLTSVSLPSGLKRIGSCLFLGCTRLSAITIPSSVTTIESNAFTHCDSIAAITLPSGLRTMGDAVCSQMAKLTTATVSGGVTYLSNYAFNDCPSLKTITLPNTVKSIGICAFRYDTALKDVYFNGSVTQWTSIQIAGEGNSALYNADVHCTGLPAPTVTGGSDAQGRPTLKWNAVTGAAKYEVYRARSMNGDYIKYSTVTGTSYTNISYIEDGNTYYYKVRALDANGTAGAWSSIVSVTYKQTLSAPTVTGGNDAQGRPTLKWNAVSGAAKYEVYRARSKDGDYIKYATVTGTSYTNTRYIENGNTYYYKVRALDANGTAGAWSSIVSVTYRAASTGTLSAPAVTGGNDAQGRPTLKWKAVTGAAKYEVYRARSLNGDYIKYSTVTGTSYTNTSYIENGNTYYYKVRALKSDGTAGAWSSVVSVTYKQTLSAPTVTGGNEAQGRPTLKWKVVTGAAKYEVYRARSLNGDYIKYSTVTGTSYTNTSYIENGNTYYYKVRALDANGTAGAWSSIVSVTYKQTLPAPTVTGGNDAQGRPTLKWKVVTGAAKYEVYRARSLNGDYIKYSTVTGTSYTNTSYIENGNTYYYKVRALDANGTAGAWSSIVSVTYKQTLPAPTVTGGNDAQGRPTLKWKVVTGAAKYEVYRARSKDGTYTKYSTTTGTAYTNSSYLTSGATYYYKVRALKSDGTAGAWSSIVSVTYRKPAAATVASGKCGDSAKWTLDAAGTLTISGTGATYDFFNDYNCTAPWYDAELRLQIKKAVVNKGITYVGTYAFRDCAELTSVSLPAGLEEMGSSVFRYCESLTSITIPAGVTSIGGDFFYGCASLKSVTLPDSLWDAGGCTFMDCASLTSVRLPANLRDIAWWMFKDCTNLTSVTIPRGIVEVKKEAFDGCTSLKNVTFTGSAADWKGVTIRPGNTALTSAAIKCTGSTVLTAPTLTLSVSKKGQPTLKWNAVSGAAGYQIWCSYDSGDGTGPWYHWLTNLDKGTASFTDDRELEKGRTYTYKVRAVTSSGAVGSFSKEVTFTYNPAASLAAPTVTGGNDAQGRPTLKWNAVTGAAKYEVYRARSRSGEYIKYSTVTGTSYTNTSYIENGNTYYYKVRALDANGTAGAWSSIVSVTYRKPAAATVASGKCGDSAKWTLDAAGTLTISGSGKTWDFIDEDWNANAPWYDVSLRLRIKKVVVEKGITYVGTRAFYDCSEMTSVSLPTTLETMGADVFMYCTGLTSVTIPDGVTFISGDFFLGCTSLKSVTLPDSLRDIGGCTFMYCTSLTSVRLPATLLSISWQMFKDCKSLTSLTIPRSVVNVMQDAFSGCTALKNVTYTGTAADWKALTIYSGNEALTRANVRCTGSTVLTAPTLTLSVSKKGQPTLKWNAVSGAAGYQIWCSYDSGDGTGPWYHWLTNLDKGTASFTDDRELEKGRTYTYKVRAVTSSGAVGSFSKEVTFTYNPAASLAAPTVTAGLDDQGYPALTWPAVPDAARYEVYRAASEDGNFAQLAAVTSNSYTNSAVLTDGAAYYYKVRALDSDGEAGPFSDVVSVTYTARPALVASGKCGDSASWKLDAEGTLTISGIGAMDNYSYSINAPWYGLAVEEAVIEQGITSIGSSAFRSCAALTSVTIPSSVTTIGDDAFYCCENLLSATIPSGVSSIGFHAFIGCDSLICVVIPESVISIGQGVFASCSKLAKVVLLDGISEIPTSAFFNCKKLTEITIPNTIESIGANAFAACDGLTGIAIPRSVTEIDSMAFEGCHTSVYVDQDNNQYCSINGALYNKEKTILYYAGRITEGKYDIPEGTQSIGDFAFAGSDLLTHVTIPTSTTNIGGYAFSNCANLLSVEIPDGVTNLPHSAFYNCAQLGNITLPKSIKSIGRYVFDRCRSLTDVYYGGTAAEWAAISVADRNDPLLNAAFHCTGQSASRLDVPAVTLGEDCSDGKPTVWWPAVTGAERYEIWRAQAASDGSAPAASAYTLIVSADVTFHKDTTAEADTWYYYKVRAVSGSTYSDFSQAARRYCEAPPTMDTPEITSLELDDSGKPVLTWRTVEGAARYQVFRSEDNGFSYSPMGTVLPTGSDTITWTDTTAVSGTGYYYGVGCYDDNGHYSSFGGGEWWVTAR